MGISLDRRGFLWFQPLIDVAVIDLGMGGSGVGYCSLIRLLFLDMDNVSHFGFIAFLLPNAD